LVFLNRADYNNEEVFLEVKNKNHQIDINQQIFYSYGRKTNDELLLSYGFALINNKHHIYNISVCKNDSKKIDYSINPLALLIPIDKKIFAESQYAITLNPEEEDEINDVKDSSKIIKLKSESFPKEFLQYLREVLRFTEKFKNDNDLMIASPVKKIFEDMVINMAITILDGILKLSKTSLEEDLKSLSSAKGREAIAIKYRISNKTIIKQNSNYLKILQGIFDNLNFTDYKNSYMKKLPGEKSSVVKENRRVLKEYLKELKLNNDRIVNQIKISKENEISPIKS